jgi:outer membrane protein assembly factor BamB
VTETHIAWRVDHVAPYVASPLVYGDSLYVVKEGGILLCFTTATGKRVWRERIGAGGAYYASPVAGDGKVYLVSERGEVTVLVASPEPEVLRQNSLGERCLATPAIVSSKLLFRTEKNLYCIGNDGTGSSDVQSP